MVNFFKDKLELLRLRLCRSNLKRWHPGDWKTLLLNSDEYLKMMALAFENNLYNQVLHNGHIAVELVIKSAISKQYKEHPHGHEIQKLIQVELNGAKLFFEINRDPVTQKHFNIVFTAWKMHYYRYIKKSVSLTEANRYLNSFKEAYEWTKKNYCQ